jgi:hypothetical protein
MRILGIAAVLTGLMLVGRASDSAGSFANPGFFLAVADFTRAP